MRGIGFVVFRVVSLRYNPRSESQTWRVVFYLLDGWNSVRLPYIDAIQWHCTRSGCIWKPAGELDSLGRK
jgi:hypothetical protein